MGFEGLELLRLKLDQLIQRRQAVGDFLLLSCLNFWKPHSLLLKNGVAPVELLKDWALPPAALPQTPLSDWDTRPQNLRAGLRNALQDVKLCARQERPRFVGRTGELLARALRDPGSVNLYRALLWGALRRKDRGEDRFEALWNALDRVLTDLQEGFAKKPGALLIARLRESGLWALLMEGAQYRVA